MPFVDAIRNSVNQERSEIAANRKSAVNKSDHCLKADHRNSKQHHCNAGSSHDNMSSGHDASSPASEISHAGTVENCQKSEQGSPGGKVVHQLEVFHRADFQVGGMVGQGSFATVHKANYVGTGRSVALKVVRPECELDFGTGPNGSTPTVCYRDVLRAMKKEVALMNAMGVHPNIVVVLGTAEDCKVFVMERAVSDLYSIVKQQETRLPLGHAKLWAEQMLAATAYIHENGIVHQDMKSSNMLVFADRTAKLCDFGLAKKGSDAMVVDRELVTLWYRAPELIMGEDTYTPKVDEWGVGCVMLEMLIGTPPFRGKPECTCCCPQITHRNFNSDQLMKIFLTIGSPEERSNLSCANHFNRWPVFPNKLESIVNRTVTAERLMDAKSTITKDDVTVACDQWLELLSNLLTHTAHKRLSAAEALKNCSLFHQNSGKQHSKSGSPAGRRASSPMARQPKNPHMCPVPPLTSSGQTTASNRCETPPHTLSTNRAGKSLNIDLSSKIEAIEANNAGGAVSFDSSPTKRATPTTSGSQGLFSSFRTASIPFERAFMYMRGTKGEKEQRKGPMIKQRDCSRHGEEESFEGDEIG